MKLNALVLFVLCGAVVNHASQSTCPVVLQNLMDNCCLEGGPLNLTNLLSSGPSSALAGLADTALELMGLCPNSTQYNSKEYTDALEDAGISRCIIKTCVIEVSLIVAKIGIDIIGCELSLLGAVIVCIGQNPRYGCLSQDTTN